MQVVIVRDPLAPVASVAMNYRVGSDETPAGFPGLAHAQEHMMFRGSAGLSADQLSAIGAELGGDFDADTTQSATQYTFTVPAADLNLILRIEAIRMQGVLDTQPLWNEERGAIEQEVARDLSSPSYVLYSKMLPILFAGTPYSHDALGTIDSFNKTTGQMLQQFHREWYAPNNAVLVIAGNVQPESTLRDVQQIFDSVPARQLPPRPQFHFRQVKPQTIRMPSDLSYGLAVLAFRTPGTQSPEYAALEIAASALNNQRSRVSALAAEGKVLGAGFSLDGLPQAGIGMLMAAFPAGEDGDTALEQLKSTLSATLRDGFPADLVQAGKRQVLLENGMRKNSISGLAMEWSQAVAIEHRQSPAEDTAAMQRVSVAEANAAARKYLLANDAVVGILTPKSSAPAAAPAAPGKAGKKETIKTTPAKPVVLPGWAAKTVERLEIPQPDIHPVLTRLPNGLTLIVQPESVSDTVEVFGHIRNSADLEAPKGQEGVAAVLSDLFPYGTESLDRIAFQKALDEAGASENAGTDFALQVLAAHFDRGVKLLADDELRPGLRDADFRIVRAQEAGVAAGRLKSPMYKARRALETALFPAGDPALREATPTTIKSLSVDDVRAYHRKVYRPDLTTIVVIGDVTPDAARAAVEKYFGAWTATGAQPPTELPPAPANKPSNGFVPDPVRVQDQVAMAQTVEITRYNPDYYALQMGNAILGGAFYATRLYRDLREETGLVYSVSSDLQAGRTRSIYSVVFGCDPANAAKAAELVRRDLELMRTATVSAPELHQAKALLLNGITLGESSEDKIAARLLKDSDLALPLDEAIRAAQRYKALTADDVRAAFAKWIRPEDLVEEVDGPAR